MLIKTKTIYYCDFCRKHRLTRNSMEVHEQHCTLNPKRECRVCEEDNEDCPMCKFSKIRLDIKNGKKPDPLQSFNLEDEVKKYWEKII